MSWKWRRRGVTESSKTVRLTQPHINQKENQQKLPYTTWQFMPRTTLHYSQCSNPKLKTRWKNPETTSTNAPAEIYFADFKGSPTIRYLMDLFEPSCGCPQYFIQRAGWSTQCKPLTSLLASALPDSYHALKRREPREENARIRLRQTISKQTLLYLNLQFHSVSQCLLY